jgi:hypothetical protein
MPVVDGASYGWVAAVVIVGIILFCLFRRFLCRDTLPRAGKMSINPIAPPPPAGCGPFPSLPVATPGLIPYDPQAGYPQQQGIEMPSKFSTPSDFTNATHYINHSST